MTNCDIFGFAKTSLKPNKNNIQIKWDNWVGKSGTEKKDDGGVEIKNNLIKL